MGIISNKEELATNELRTQALEILEAGLEAINTEKVLRKKISITSGVLNIEGGNELDLKSFNRVIFVGIGKCALDGAKVIEEILGDYLMEGAVIDVKPTDESKDLKKIRYFEGTHPLPSEQNVSATKKILEMVKDLTEKDLVITLISGGGSSLFELPVDGFDLNTIIEKTKEFTAKGADIYELNAVRKQMSQVKGGKFAETCSPARMVSLIFSDVPGNNISVIASGPTILTESEDRIKNIMIVSNTDALEAMESKAEELGFFVTTETDRFSGNAGEMGKELALREPKNKTCILFGGETTVIIPQNHGVGGRNQEMALSALPYIKLDSVLVCATSDGWDNNDHAGALVDLELFEKSKQAGISPEEFLMHGDSYNFFKEIKDGAIYTGKLGSNVSDLYIMLYK